MSNRKKKAPTPVTAGLKLKLNPTSFTPEDLAAMRTAEAEAAKGTPKVVLAALMPPAHPTIAGRVVHQPTLDTVIALEAIDSPYLRDGAVAKLPDIADAILIMVTPPDEVEELVADRAAFRQASRAFARQIPVSQIRAVATSVGALLNAAFSTAIPVQPGDATDEDPQKKTPAATHGN